MKEQNAFFKKIYDARFTEMGAVYFNASVFKKAFSGSTSANLPVTDVVTWKGVTSDCGTYIILGLKPSGPKGCRKHRVFTLCGKCSKWVLAGRIAQHRC